MVVSGRTWFTPGIPGIYVVLLCDVLRDLGHDPAALLKTLGLKREQLLDSVERSGHVHPSWGRAPVEPEGTRLL